MRSARLAGVAALVLSTTGVLPLAATAQATVTDLYVDQNGGHCSDLDPAAGSQAVPYCKISTAAKVVLPGQTVHIASAYYDEKVELTRSGTAEAPITFAGPELPVGSNLLPTASLPSITVRGAHDVNLRNLRLPASQEALLVADSQRITLDRFRISGWTNSATSYPASARLTGHSSDITLSRSVIADSHGDALVVDPGVAHAVITTNLVSRSQGRGITVTGAPGTVITNNNVNDGCGPRVSLAGGTSGSVVENNLFYAADGADGPYGACPASVRPDLAVTADSTAGTIVDYNIVLSSASAPYVWGDKTASNPADFLTKSGQGAHDLAIDKITYGDPATAAMIDSGDANAPGVLDTDVLGQKRVDDPQVANTGTGSGFVDRGAREITNPLVVKIDTLLPKTETHQPLTVVLNGSVTSPWGPAPATVDWGDGSAPEPAAAFPLTHTYAATGYYLVTLTATDGNGKTTSASSSVNLLRIDDIKPAVTVDRSGPGPLAVTAKDNSTSPWPVTEYRYDFGDGTAPVVTKAADAVPHSYAAPGSYTVTETVTDDHGRSAIATRPVTVGGSYVPLKPARILDTRTGLGTPKHRVDADGSVKLKVTGQGGVPDNGKVTSVLLNLTATGASEPTHVIAWSGVGAKPTVSNLNAVPGRDVGNAALVPVAPDGTVTLYNHSGSLDLIADVQGYSTLDAAAAPLQLGVQPAVRALDTRTSGKVGDNSTIRVKVRGNGLLPDSAKVAVFNLTATEASDSTYVTAAPDGTPPSTSSLNVSRGQTVANQVTVPIDADGTVALYNHSGSIQLIVDLQGYYAEQADGVAPVVTTSPTRVLDTRTAGLPVYPDDTRLVKVRGVAGVPDNARAVIVNLTATNPTEDSWLSVHGDPLHTPATSNVNVTPGATVANLAVVPISADGYIFVHNHTGRVDAIVDIQGYVAN